MRRSSWPKIGSDKGYRDCQLGIRKIKAAQALDVAQAEALKSADVKVISTAVAGMLEGMAQSGEGKKLLDKLGKTDDAA